MRSLQNSHIAVMVKFCLCLCVQKKSGKKKIVLSAMHSIVKATEVELKKSIISSPMKLSMFEFQALK